jgi:PAS domain S-box-containing protein
MEENARKQNGEWDYPEFSGEQTRGLLFAVLNSSPQGVVVCDGEGRILLANKRAGEMFGYQAAELHGAQVEQLLPEYIRESHRSHRARYFAAPAVRPMGFGLEFTGLRRDGSRFPAEVSLNYIDDPGGGLAVAMVTDATASKSGSERSLHSQKMEALGRLAGGIAHDFNNLLTVIKGHSDLLLKELTLEDAHFDPILEISKASRRATSLITQLLTFSRMRTVQPAAMDLNAVTLDVEKMIRRLIGENIELAVTCAPSPAMVYADAGQIEQVLVNLAVNARDAMPQGGTLRIAIENLVLGAPGPGVQSVGKAGPYTRLTVCDTGMGMSAEVREHIFEPFFTTKSATRGTGLGLATVLGVVQQSGGWITVASAPEEGATFEIFLPRIQPTVTTPGKSEAPAARSENSLRGSETLLVVEDEAEVRTVAVNVFRRLGYQILEAANGAEALALCANYKGKIDLLVADVVMPGMTGLYLAGQMVASRPSLKVLYLSGYTPEVFPGIGDSYLAKPYTAEALASKARELLDVPPNRRTILMVDDDESVREFLRAVLETEGYQLLEAASGRGALQQLREQQVDLVLLDVRIPGEIGEETVAGMLRLRPGLNIVTLSGGLDTIPGAAAALQKPIDPEVLIETIRSVLAR